MRKNNLAFFAAAAALAFASGAEAAPVKVGGTGSTGAGNFTLVSSGVSTDVGHPLYDNSPTVVGGVAIASDWVWPIIEGGFDSSAIYEFVFDLTGFDLASATLEGLWGADNFGAITLNGNEIDALPGEFYSNFAVLHAFSTTLDAYFNAGVNVLRFTLGNAVSEGINPAAFRAAVRVTAVDLSEVPLPGALPLFAAGIASFAFARGRRRSTS